MTLPQASRGRATRTSTSVGVPLLRARGRPGSPAMQAWAGRFGFGEPDGPRRRRRSRTGLLPTPEWRRATFTSWDRPAWKPGDSIQLAIGQKDLLGDTAPDGAFSADRERRHARYAVRRLAGREPAPAVSAGCRPALRARPARAEGRRPGCARGDPRRPLPGDARDVRHLVGVFATSPSPSRQDRARPRGRADPRLPAGGPRGPVGRVGYGPSQTESPHRRGALIENGGHGADRRGAAAARPRELLRCRGQEPGDLRMGVRLWPLSSTPSAAAPAASGATTFTARSYAARLAAARGGGGDRRVRPLGVPGSRATTSRATPSTSSSARVWGSASSGSRSRS